MTRNHQILAAMVKKAWAMPLRGRSAVLRTKPASRSYRLRAAATIAARFITATAIGWAIIFAYGAVA